MEQPILESSRLLIRELKPTDDDGMFALDSNPKVHEHLGNNPVKTIDQSRELIESVRQQYRDHGVGRWALVEKQTGIFVGWTGFKFNTETINGHQNFLDVGYRLREEYWGMGYASEAAVTCLNYAFANWRYERIFGMAMQSNKASIKILKEKLGMRPIGTFNYHGARCNCYELGKKEWLNKI
jgi:RimJ/RimL family protein N-acetyltransferase